MVGTRLLWVGPDTQSVVVEPAFFSHNQMLVPKVSAIRLKRCCQSLGIDRPGVACILVCNAMNLLIVVLRGIKPNIWENLSQGAYVVLYRDWRKPTVIDQPIDVAILIQRRYVFCAVLFQIGNDFYLDKIPNESSDTT